LCHYKINKQYLFPFEQDVESTIQFSVKKYPKLTITIVGDYYVTFDSTHVFGSGICESAESPCRKYFLDLDTSKITLAAHNNSDGSSAKVSWSGIGMSEGSCNNGDTTCTVELDMTNINAPSISINTNSFSCVEPVKIGDRCGGGIVFYVDGAAQHGLIAAITDAGNIYGSNTISVVWDLAKSEIENYSVQGDGITPCTSSVGEICYSDWYFPSISELELLSPLSDESFYPGRIYGNYWSSTQYDSTQVWSMRFPDGEQYPYLQRHETLMPKQQARAIRAF
jgi:hypothetical protein